MATNLELMQTMMEEIGPNMAEIEAVIQSEDRNWAIQLEDQSIIMLEWADKRKLIFTAKRRNMASSMSMFASSKFEAKIFSIS